MRTLLITTMLSTVLSTTVFAQAQTSRVLIPMEYPTNIERYNVDYSLKNYTFENGDSTILNSIPLENYEHLRSPNTDIEVYDPISGETLILFFEKRSKSTTTQLQNR